MNNNFPFLFDGYNDFGFYEDLDPTHTSWIPDIAPSPYPPQLEPDFVSTPTSLSLATPTEPPFDTFICPPPLHPIPQQFTSEGGWPLSDSDHRFQAAPYHHIAGHIPHSNSSGWYSSGAPQTLLEETNALLNEANEWPCPTEFYNVEEYSKDKTQAITGPKRVERSRNRQQAPYMVDTGHEGAEMQKIKSQQAFTSETLGYETDNNAPKPTRRRKKTPPTTDQQIAGPSTGVNVRQVEVSPSILPPQRRRPCHQTPTGVKDVGPLPKKNALTAIRRHARSKQKEITFIYTDGHEKWA